MDLSQSSRTEIVDLIEAANRELAHRQTFDVFREKAGELQAEYRAAMDIVLVDFAEWEPPTFILDAPAYDQLLTYQSAHYRSNLPCNLRVPGLVGYRPVNRDGTPTAWYEPQEDFDGWRKGELAELGGVVYESLEDANMSAPGPASESWVRLVEPTDGS